MLPWKPHTSQVASYLSARRPRQSDVAQFQLQWRNLCCNPFNKPHHFSRKKSQLGVVTVPAILPGEICDSFGKQLAAESERQSLPQGHSDSFPESPTDEMSVHPLAALAVANEHLPSGKHLSPVQEKLLSKLYRSQSVNPLQQ